MPLILITLDPNATQTPTPFQPAAATDSPNPTEVPTDVPADAPTDLPTDTPTATATLSETATPTRPAATETVPPIPSTILPAATPTASGSRTLYTLYLTLDYSGHRAEVNEDIRYVNNTGQSLSTIVLAVEPNLWSGCFTLSLLYQDGAAVSDYTLEGQKLAVPLLQPLEPGATTSLSLGYSMALPWKTTDSTFGYRSDQMNLTDWYPFIVPFDGDWLLHDPWSFGEHLVYDAADFDVYVMEQDPGVVLAASAPGQVNGSSMHYRLDGARTFVVSASDSYQVEESAVGPVKIEAYSLPGHEDANKAVVWMATQSVGLYQAKFAPYPYQSLSIVESNMSDGQEYDGLVFLASKFYDDYNGTAKSNLFSIGTHEVAHQWWFGLVGDDQAMEPWLDEALAVYSERIFYQYNYPGYGEWWWNFRVNYFGPSGYVDGNLYSFTTFKDYVGAVYLNGAKMLEELRGRVGDDSFFAFLQDYALSYSGQRATTRDFFAVLRRHTDKDFSDIMQTYLQGQY
jgi:Peptidase family M1 domain